MTIYTGFTTINECQPRPLVRPGIDGGTGGIVDPLRIGKKFKLTDEQLVLRDLLNAFSIKQGDKVGQPGYGTNIWSYLFDPNTADLRGEIENEVQRIVASDPRIILNSIGVYSRDNGILIELQIAINPFNNATQVGFFLNRFDGSVQQTAQ